MNFHIFTFTVLDMYGVVVKTFWRVQLKVPYRTVVITTPLLFMHVFQFSELKVPLFTSLNSIYCWRFEHRKYKHSHDLFLPFLFFNIRAL